MNTIVSNDLITCNKQSDSPQSEQQKAQSHNAIKLKLKQGFTFPAPLKLELKEKYEVAWDEMHDCRVAVIQHKESIELLLKEYGLSSELTPCLSTVAGKSKGALKIIGMNTHYGIMQSKLSKEQKSLSVDVASYDPKLSVHDFDEPPLTEGKSKQQIAKEKDFHLRRIKTKENELELRNYGTNIEIAEGLLDHSNNLRASHEKIDPATLLDKAKAGGDEESINQVALRIAELRYLKKLVEADSLESKLVSTAKSLNIKPRTIKTLIMEAEKQTNKTEEQNYTPSFEFHVLGYNSDRKILIWNKGRLLYYSPHQLTHDELSLLMGEVSEAETVKTTIVQMAHEKGFVDEGDPIKLGVWKFAKQWIVVSGKSPTSIKSGVVKPFISPVFQDRIISLENRGWIKSEKINLKHDLKSVYEKLLKYISQWEWASESVARHVTAFVMLAPFQQAMSWRPWLYITGQTSCGKSAFFEYVLEQIYSSLVKKVDKSTAHSVAQSVGGTCKILVLDEFEKNKHIGSVLELLKLMSRGGVKTSGTPGQKELTFNLNHMPWLASIFLPTTLASDESQRNRIILFELKKIPSGKHLDILTVDESEGFCAEIVSSVLASWGEIQEKASSIEKQAPQIARDSGGMLSGRSVQNFMYSCALISTATGIDSSVPDWARRNEQKDDGRTIIEAILKTKLRYENSEYLVSDLIERACGEPATTSAVHLNESGAQTALRLHGLSVVSARSGEGVRLAIDPQMIRKSLLKGDPDLNGLDISAPIERIEGACKKLVRWSGDCRARAVLIPMDYIFPTSEDPFE